MNKKFKKWLLLLGLAAFLSGTASLAMPPKQGLLEPDPLTGLSKLTGKPIVIPPPRPAGVDSPEPFKAELVTGTNKILLIVIDYPDLAHTQTADSFTNMVNGPWATGSLNDYFQEVSYNQFGVNGVTMGWYIAANNHTYYANNDGTSGTDDDFGFGDYPNNAPRLVEEAVDAAEAAGVNFADYDNDGDGNVDTVSIVHAGKGGEATNDASDIWSHKWSISSGGGTARNYDGVTINTYNIQPELNITGGHIEMGVFAHEYGHVLGLPDLYDTIKANGTSKGIGNFGLMAGGAWGGDGNSPEKPTHPCAWSKIYLEWLTPTVIQVDTLNQQINQIETNAEVYKLYGKPDKEYFLVSNRQKVGFDAKLPGSGLLIWHIDEEVINANMASNTVNGDENHKGVDLEEADGLNHLDDMVNGGDAGDLYPGSSTNRTFNESSNPNSKLYDGSASEVSVTKISDSASVMTADLTVLRENQPPTTPPAPTGPDTGRPNTSYDFTATTTDPDGDQVAFKFDWGDGSESDWTSYVDSGSSASKSHSWSTEGTYYVKVKAKDTYNAESGWSAGHSITIRAVVLEVDPSSLDFDEVGKSSTKIMTFRAYNAGGGTLSGTISVNRNWMTVSPTSFEGNDNTISVTVSTEGLAESHTPYIGTITVTSNGGTKTIEVSVIVIPTGAVVYPNPFSLARHNNLTFWGTGVPYAEIRIFTLAGELVKTLDERYGASEVSWDGRNEKGDKVARGIYIYIVKNFTGKIAIIK